MRPTVICSMAGLALLPLLEASTARAGSEFTYQGRLNQSGVPAGGLHDFSFGLYTAADGGSQVGTTVTRSGIAVNGGLFSVPLDFGAGAFDGTPRWLQTTVAPGRSGTPVSLSPRTPVTAAPFALYSLKTATPQQTLLVAKSGGDFSSVQAAINSVTDASSTSPFVIRIAPGIYTEQVTLKPWITLQGLDQKSVVLRWTGGSEDPMSGAGSATVRSTGNSALQNLTVESEATGGTGYAAGIRSSGSSFRVSDVSVQARGGSMAIGWADAGTAEAERCTLSAENAVQAYTILQQGGSLSLTSVRASATATTFADAILLDAGALTLAGCDFRAAAGNSCEAAWLDGPVTASNCTFAITGVGNGSALALTSGTSTLDNCRISSTRTGGIETGVLVQYAGTVVALTDCSVTMTGSATSIIYGVSNASAHVTLNGCTVNLSGGATSYGIEQNSAPVTTILNDTRVTLSAGSNGYGMYSNGGNLSAKGSNLSASGSSSAYGIFGFSGIQLDLAECTVKGTDASSINYGINISNSGAVTARNCQITGSARAVHRSSTSVPVRLANCQLTGPLAAGLTCFSNYDVNMTAVTCP